MEDRKRSPELTVLEERIGKLEGLADALGSVPDGELVETLNRAVGLLAEINSELEDALRDAGEEAREVGELLGRMDFGPFDAALEELERRGPDEHAP
jgi:hypothetical protein